MIATVAPQPPAPAALPLRQPLPIARYRLSAELQQSLRLPEYAGSLLRGPFGAALRAASCMTRMPRCDGCPLQSTCPYPQIFEAPAPADHSLQRFSAIPNAYVIEPPLPPAGLLATPAAQRAPILAAGQRLQFHHTLIGSAIRQLPLVIHAWQRALARGLGSSRAPARLELVEWIAPDASAQPIWSASQPRIASHDATLTIPAAPAALQSLSLHIHTPMRLQHQGRPLHPVQLSPRALLAALARRAALVLEFHAQDPAWGPHVPAAVEAAHALSDQRALRWFDWTRYSARQQQEMTLGGVLGTWQLSGPPDALATAWPWLWLGQWLHVGKNATMGLGGYSLHPAA